MWFPVLQKSGSSPARPEQNMLPHTFLPGPERRGESEEVRGEERGRTGAGVWLAEEKERVTERRRRRHRKRENVLLLDIAAGIHLQSKHFEFGLKGEQRRLNS